MTGGMLMSMAATSLDSPRKATDALLARLRSDRVAYLPIRHHSPACAWHVRRTIMELEPSAVLIEGPSDLTSVVRLILDPDARTPFAIYSTYVDKAGRIVPIPDDGRRHDPPRFAGYYPFCEYSPELVALRAGQEVKADLRFIDLTYPEQVIAETPRLLAQTRPRTQSLLEETRLGSSRYLRELSRRSGCRDVNDLWDHLFEASYARVSTDEFFRRVATYCLMARNDTPAQALEEDGTTTRERAMAAEIRSQLVRNKSKRRTRPVVVVTGGFHTAVLPQLVEAKVRAIEIQPLTAPTIEAHSVMMRYSFDRLDALNGYGAGMPAPRYYDQVWRLICEGHPDPYLETAGRVVVEIGRISRERELSFALSTADEIAALEQSRRLAWLRGHPGPTREDLLDGIRGSFVKGALDVEGAVVMSIVAHVLGGTEVGEVPAAAGVPPLVDDFRARAKELGLALGDTTRKKLALDLYRSHRHRKLSRLLHSVEFLNVPFGAVTAGPDFVSGCGLELLREHWIYSWSPFTESALIEASVYGSTVEEAAINRLRQALADLEQTGHSRSTAEAVRMLVRACRMGLHRQVELVIDLIARNITEDPAFASLVGGLSELAVLWHSREPLEAHGLVQIQDLANSAYRRACLLVRGLAACPADETESTLQSLASLRQTIAATQDQQFDASLFLDSLLDLYVAAEVPPPIAGGAAGILFGEGRLTEDQLLELTAGYLAGTGSEMSAKTAFLQGLLFTCREATWRLPALLERIDRRFRSWNEDDFRERAAGPASRLRPFDAPRNRPRRGTGRRAPRAN